MKKTAAGLAAILVLSITDAGAETEADLDRAIREMENVKLGGDYTVNTGAFACSDKGKLMSVERMAGGDKVCPSSGLSGQLSV